MSSPRYAPPKDLTKFAWISIAAALFTIVLKGSAALLTGSVGLLSDAAESLVNLVAAAIALIALKLAIKPADADHQYGHSKAEYFSAAAEGLMIFVAATFIIYSAIERMVTPAMPQQLGIGMLISVIASLVNGGVGYLLYVTGLKEGSKTLVADAKHLFTDVITSVAVLIGVLLVWLTDLAILDAIVALLAGLNILFTGFQLVKESVAGLMDAAIPADVRSVIDEVLDRHKQENVAFHAIRTREAGNKRFMTLHVLVPGDWSVRRGHDYVEDLIDELVIELPELRVTAHLEPIEDPKSYEDIDEI